ncbi:MAG: M56 family metallopeptidase [bacterium]
MIVKELLSLAYIDVVGLWLIHLMWQGFLIAILTGIILFVFNKTSAKTKYIVYFVSLLLTVLLPSITTLYKSSEDVSIVHAKEITPTQSKEILLDGKYVATQYRRHGIVSEYNEKIIKQIGTYLPFITIIWVIGVLLISIYHIFCFFKLLKFVEQTRQSLELLWEKRIQKLIKNLNIRRKINIFKIPGLDSPVVIGFLKPFLLIPISFFTGMSEQSIEAIILHELAHIKRYDYLLNMIQIIIEVLGFFHPAIWWLSKRIREERENCCDDIAINIIGDRVVYAKSLIQLEEYRDNSKLVLAGNGGNLFFRTSRILQLKNNNNFSASLNLGGYIVPILLLFFLMGFIWKQNGNLWELTKNQPVNESFFKNIAHNLVAFFPFNGNANDESGYDQNGTINNATLTEDRLGRANCAFDFSGKDSYICVPKISQFNTSGSITVSCWIFPRRSENWESWISKANSSSRTSQWRIGFGENGNKEWGITQCILKDKQNIWTDLWITDNLIPLNKWTQVIFVANQTKHFVNLFINGKKVVQIDNLKSFEPSQAPLYFGFQTDDWAFFDGKIDDVRIYNRALTDQEANVVYSMN